MSNQERRQKGAGVLVLVAIVALWGCGELADSEGEAMPEVSESQQASIWVTPEFRVSGLEELGDDVQPERLALTVEELRLIPAKDCGGDQALVEKGPFELEWNLDEGETAWRASPIEVDKPGIYQVEVDLSGGEEQSEGLMLTGETGPELSDDRWGQRQSSDESDGNPLPLPADQRALMVQSGSIEAYQADAPPVSLVSEIVVEPGEQLLGIDLELDAWVAGGFSAIFEGQGLRKVGEGEAVETPIELREDTRVGDELVDASMVTVEGAF